MSDINNTLEERQKTHGNFANMAAITQCLKSLVRTSANYNKMTNTQKEALDMIMHKVGRICCGDPHMADHWHDIAGYATLQERECNKN